MTKTFKVKLKSIQKLKKYARHFGGDMSESNAYVLKHNGELVDKRVELNDVEGGFIHVVKHVMENGEEFLVVDHLNIITKVEYERTKALYEEIKKSEPSMKGVC